ncbi:MAG TPA: methylated-DNA--[protein]-cysteine S-methyltransferase [Steroidobacteraceae bacterium]|jgi:methylated-DNA-[protein]-cysteine S-methyltransferase
MNVYCFVDSPIGPLMLSSDGEALTGLYMGKPSKRPNLEGWVEDAEHPVLKKTARQLQEYFAGKRRHFELPLKFNGTEFQRRVWQLLTEIPFGETRTYGQLARQLDNPSACRAVGLANGKNPIAVIVPCHRVIGADGSLTGFGGGLPRKEWLLSHEGFAGIRTLDLAI